MTRAAKGRSISRAEAAGTHLVPRSGSAFADSTATVDDPALNWRPVFFAAVTAILALGGTATGWAMYARLDSAVVAQGVMLAESERKTVEHLEGGILQELLVRPGDRVAEGQVVARLDATQVHEQIEQLLADKRALEVDIWRLAAESAGLTELDRSEAPQPNDPSYRARIEAAEALFDARWNSHTGQVTALRRQIGQLEAQAAASDGQASAADRQLAIWAGERDSTASLVETGASARIKLHEIDRRIAELEGERDENRGLADAAREEMGRAEAEIVTLEHQRLVDIRTQLADSRREVAGIVSQLRAAQDVLARHELRAPQGGLVVDVYTVTPGAVIGSGVPVMDIVPDEDRLVAEARLSPNSVDTVYVGRQATVRLTAYRRAQAPVVDGEVIHVSADMLEDERDGTAYFIARVEIDPDDLASYPGVTLSAGMPVEVAIRTGERRAGDYLLEPIMRHFHRAMREE
jgi:HlyD family secretion protein